MSTRARASVSTVGTALLLLLLVGLAASVGAVALEHAETTADGGTQAALSLTATGETLQFVHRGGETLDVRRLDLRVRVDGRPLDHHPPVPFFSADGFRPGPTGPFNAAASPEWRAGETASVTVAGTNDPELPVGSSVTVGVRYAGRPLVTLSAAVR
ncbi:type IV pilin [Haloprofundus salinisoli]|uniref:type IV pilin n=1 Tax=Haloprofundus salinisoli TaxID=2876193 RepID=UPI001CC94DCC|nr:type IV pilin [Haloprofundus salinisoli]